MQTEPQGTQDGVLKRFIITPLLIIASLYSLYLVVHPYTPLSKLSISILDLTQVQRATHVFFLLLTGYLLSSIRADEASRSWLICLRDFGCISALRLLADGVGPAVQCCGHPFLAGGGPAGRLSPLGPWVNKVGAILAIVPFVYLVIYFQDIIERAMMPEPWDLVMGFGLTLLLLGQVYRYTGAILPSLVLIFLLYNLYGDKLSGVFSHPSFAFDLLLGKLFSETEAGLFGLITGVSMKYLVYFTILGGMIGVLNLGRIIANIASLAARGRAEGPGIVTAWPPFSWACSAVPARQTPSSYRPSASRCSKRRDMIAMSPPE